jgi:hypothetical protein
VADIPDQLVLKIARDREGKRDVKFRRVAVALLALFLGLGLGNISFIPKRGS